MSQFGEDKGKYVVSQYQGRPVSFWFGYRGKFVEKIPELDLPLA